MQDTTTASSNHYFSQWLSHQLWPSISLQTAHFESVPKNFLKVKKCNTYSKTSKSNGLYLLLQISNWLYSILTLRPEPRFTSDDGFISSKNFYKNSQTFQFWSQYFFPFSPPTTALSHPESEGVFWILPDLARNYLGGNTCQCNYSFLSFRNIYWTQKQITDEIFHL